MYQRKYPQRKKYAAAKPTAQYRSPVTYRAKRGATTATRSPKKRLVATPARFKSAASRSAGVGYRRGYSRGGHRYGKTKRMVEGPPTLLDQIASGVGSVARLATAVAPMLEMINTEAKFFDTASTNNATLASPLLIILTDTIAQGDGENQRIGTSILAKDIQVRLFFTKTVDPTSATPGCYLRVIFFCWKEDSTQNPPTVAKLLALPSTFSQFTNKSFTDCFVILKDKMIALEPSSINQTLTATLLLRHMKWYKKLDWHIRWETDAGSPAQNHVYMAVLNSSTQAVAVTCNSRLNFTDN